MDKKNVSGIVRNELPLWVFVLLGAYAVTGILLFLLAFLVYQFHLAEQAVEIAIIVTYILANFIAGFVMGRKKKVKKYLYGFGMGVTYFVLLVVVSLIANHGLQDFAGNFFTTLAICAGAGTIGGMLS